MPVSTKNGWERAVSLPWMIEISADQKTGLALEINLLNYIGGMHSSTEDMAMKGAFRRKGQQSCTCEELLS
jgi:hypothetical protein